MRYIGNKQKLLLEIDNLISEKNIKIKGLTFCDAFSGTATVANNYNGFFKIISNDLLDFSYEYSSGLLLFKNTLFPNLNLDPFLFFNNTDTSNYTSGFCYNNFSPNGGCQYFSDENAKMIDFIRDTIDNWFLENKISREEKSYLIACLLEAVSKVANVAGVYSAFLKIWDPRATKKLNYIPLEVKETEYINYTYCSDISNLINHISGDILYIDPPYTPTQYNSQYHVLETIVRNDNPLTHGIGKHRDNDRLSNWCKKGKVEYEFTNLIKECNFKHIIFSYSDKGIMSLKFIESVLKRYGKPETFTFKKIDFVKYKNSRAVNREILENNKTNKHYEYLFYIEKKDKPKYNSPLNYIGGKYDTIDMIKSFVPKNIDTFYDLFGGGGSVAINMTANKIVYNDINIFVTNLLKYLSENHPFDIYTLILKYTKKYKLEKGNKEGYIELRKEYNKTKSDILLYLLMCYGFEHQIRFNSKHEFNNPCGNSSFNDEMYEKLISFYLRCKEINIEFNSTSYEKFLNIITSTDFVYLDPPYLGINGVYQDGKRGFNSWDKTQELQLHNFIEYLNNKNINFILSNYIEHSTGNQNPLENWCAKNCFTIVTNEKITKRNRQNRREIIVLNSMEELYGNKSKNI